MVTPGNRLRSAAHVLGVAVVYTLTAHLGLALDPVGGFATVVWAPTGIAIAALLVLGRHAAIGVALGALVANLWSGAPFLVAAGIAFGNTMEALVAVFLLRRLSDFDASLSRVRDVLAFLGLAAVLAPVLSATIGVSSLRAAGVMSPGETWEAWRAWWVGDCIGALLVAPFLLSWRAGARRFTRPQALEYGAVLGIIAVMAGLVFFGRTGIERAGFLHTYLLFPPLIWAAVRFEQPGTSAAILLAAIVAIGGTARGGGPFAALPLQESLFQLQTFSGIFAASFLVLAAAIAERSAAQLQLRHALRAETDANRAKSDFLAVMSHELRTPLNAISGYSHLMGMDLYGPLTEKQRDALQRIQRNQTQLAGLVDDLLNFVKTEAGQLTVVLETVAVADAVARLSAFLELEIARKRQSLRIGPIDPNVMVRADSGKLGQILLNIVGNAVKYTPEDGRIELDVHQRERDVLIRVGDSGIGIPADQLARVFEPFFQVERGMTRRYPGAGLGLSIARDLARAMNGDVTIESRPGAGTTVNLVLPRDISLSPSPSSSRAS